MVAVGEAILERARAVGRHIQEQVQEVLCAERAPVLPIDSGTNPDG